MYRAVTHAIEVTVVPRFLPERSAPDNGYYFWAYTIAITNRGTETVQLRTRHWLITDAHGRLQEVRLGRTYEGWYEIVSGVQEGQRVIFRSEISGSCTIWVEQMDGCFPVPTQRIRRRPTEDMYSNPSPSICAGLSRT